MKYYIEFDTDAKTISIRNEKQITFKSFSHTLFCYIAGYLKDKYNDRWFDIEAELYRGTDRYDEDSEPERTRFDMITELINNH